MEERTLENEVTVDELEENLTEEMEQEQPEEESREADEADEAIRAGLAELFEDGWTTAACAYLRRSMAAPHRYGVPTARTTAAGSVKPDNRIEHMTDRQFDAFSRRARAAMMEGRKVRIE